MYLIEHIDLGEQVRFLSSIQLGIDSLSDDCLDIFDPILM